MRSIENKSVELFWGYLYPFCSTFINHSGPMLSTNTNTSMNDIDDIDDINNKNVLKLILLDLELTDNEIKTME